MNIGIDARTLVEEKTGIGIYLESILNNILLKDKVNKYYLFSDRKIYFSHVEYNNLMFVENSGKVLKKTLWYLLELPKLLEKYDINLFWGSQHVLPVVMNKKIKTVLTIHDLVYYEMPETMQLYNRIINRVLVPLSVKKADSIIAVSNSTKNGLIKYIGSGVVSNKTQVIYEAADIPDIDREDETKYFNNHPNILPEKYLLYIGTLEPRKNINTLLKAFELIRKKAEVKLVICGKVGWKCQTILENIKNNTYSKDIIYLDYVGNIEKFILMKNCLFFIFPSLYEGFGLPVIEAMKVGALTLVSNSSSLKELIEIQDLKFAADDYNELTNKLLEIYRDREKYIEYKNYCLDRGKAFQWSESAEKYIDVFHNTMCL